MPDIADGESVEMQGSGAKPYVLKNVGGVYSCSCPAWRNQSLAIEQRTCKHLRKYRGDAAEDARIGGAAPEQRAAKTKSKSAGDDDATKQEPPLLLAESWDQCLDLSGWWMSEKLDGVRAYWDGQQFLSRQGNLYLAPDWFIEGLPDVPLDGELWIDRKAFQKTVSIVRRQDRSEHWKAVQFVIFDAPEAGGVFEERLAFLQDGARGWRNSYVAIHEHIQCRHIDHLREELERIEALGGEGLMLRQPGSKYASGRSSTLLKVKTFHDAEAVVIGHEPGKGRHQGRLGALTVRLPNGNTFSIGTGFSDKQREQPPAVGALVQFRYQELTDAGIPRFPSYVGVRTDVAAADVVPTPHQQTEATTASRKKKATKKTTSARAATSETTATKEANQSAPQLAGSRYFEFVEGKSNKFWEIETSGNTLTTRWGRIGSKGQSKTKTFSSTDEARSEYESAIASKLANGYQEIPASAPDEDAPTASATMSDVDDDEPLDTAALNGVDELLAALTEEFVGPESSDDEPAADAVMQIHLERAEDEILVHADDAAALNRQFAREGFTLIGDFAIRELPVQLRAFFRAPNVLAVVSELGPMLWIDISVQNADGTSECWSNVPMHDGVTPPWATIDVRSDADLQDLLELMKSNHSGKEPAQLTAEMFVEKYETDFARSMQWRASPSEPEVAAPPTNVSQRIQDMVWEFALEYDRSGHFYKDSAPDAVKSGKALMKLSDVELIEVVKACFLLSERIIDETRHDTVRDLRERLLKRKLPYTTDDIEFLANALIQQLNADTMIELCVIGAIEQWRKSNVLSDQACASLRQVRDRLQGGFFNRDAHKTKARIDALVGDDAVRNPIKKRETWATTAIDDIEQMPANQRTLWLRLLHHCVTATTGKPSKVWINEAKSLIAKISRPTFLNYANKWFPLVDKPMPDGRRAGWRSQDPLALDEGNQDILRGLVWCCSFEPDADTARTLGALAISAYRKIRFVGARAIRVGNACVFALGMMGDATAVAQLAMLKVKVKFGTAQRFVHAELDKAAERLGLSRDELEEMSVPAFGMEEVGLRTESLGDFTAELHVGTSGKTELRWLKPDGSPQKSIPSAIQKECADEIKELKAAAKDIEKMLLVQRDRIDSFFLQPRSWPYAAWRDRYIDHPLVAIMARRLIWEFHQGDNVAAGIFLNGEFVGSDDRPLPAADAQTTVTLWHPIGRPIREITAWRDWLERHQLQQPFKQAHREVYLLTDAERQTRIYSNRFAAHVLRQTQFRALASVRGWQTTLLGYWDGGDSAQATRRLPHWNLVAQFWIQGFDPDQPGFEGDFDSTGMPYVGTDQIRFCPADDPNSPLPLADIPQLVFSEIMRDADLFVGVASLGNDPTWMDQGPDRQFVDYWNRFSFGELSATAQTRKDVLERLVPRLAIADRCQLTDRFLVVRGDLRTYKIHLGSGNILMEPNDQYLCIVPKSAGDASTASIFLPFEGDRTLSIILSKALLLAADKKIKDPTITRQIQFAEQ